MKKSNAQGQPIAYVAFLRGINVGGNKLIKMTEVVKAFEKAGFQKVKTLLASGNVLFEAAESAKALRSLALRSRHLSLRLTNEN